MSAKQAPQPKAGPLSLLFVGRILIGFIFIVSGFQKLVQPPQNFLYVVQNFEIIPEWAEFGVAHGFPWIELFGGVFLSFGLWTRTVARVLWVACSGFILILSQALIRNLPIDSCGCFGEMIRMPLLGMLLLDAAIWVLFGLLALFESQAKRFSLDKRFDRA